ncbi:anti-sigma regulatory factor [Leptolyngbya ohadii]|uniref:anti-sigma regulatory factor n=1 Tax=Leptolyngbya ohadii TaxID=1962290 RepID=UPI000B59EC69|nr:anti-sigma regulatory factor [Leptolyngbya ohadii]
MPDREVLLLRDSADIVLVRQKARAFAVQLGFSLVEQTKIVTAVSELARNTVDYGGGGSVTLEVLMSSRIGLRFVFEDQGPGIVDINLALQDGYTTGKGLGLGLSGAKRLMHDFDIASEPGKGTRVEITRWR